MRVLVQNTLTNRQWVAVDGPAGFLIGRDENCEVRLESRFVAGVHARVERNDGAWEIEVLPGVNPVDVDGRECAAGHKASVTGPAKLKIMEFVLTLDPVEREQDAAEQDAADRFTDLQNLLHAELLRRLDLRLGAYANVDASADRTEKLNNVVDDLLAGEFRTRVFESDITPLILSLALGARLNEWVFTRLAREQRMGSELD